MFPYLPYDPEIMHASVREAIMWYFRHQMPWLAKSFQDYHEREYGTNATCEYCQKEILGVMADTHERDSNHLFKFNDTPVPNGAINLGKDGKGIPFATTPFGIMIPLDVLPDEVKTEVLKKINASRE